MTVRSPWQLGPRALLALVALVALAAAGCGELKTPTEPAGPGGGTAYTFTQIQARVFTPTCARSGCHDAAAATLGLVLAPGQSYERLVNRPSVERSDLDRVEPGLPERSYLVKKLRGDADIVGERMPFGGAPLSAEDLAGIVGWIQAGAPND